MTPDNPNKKPLQENTKDDSSDVEKVRKDLEENAKKPSPTTPDTTTEEEEAEKGHS